MKSKKNLIVVTFGFIVNIIYNIYACPNRCKCQKEDRVYCSRFTSRDMEEISRHIPLNTKRLYLLDGAMEEFPVEQFQQFKSLEFLNLYTNKIKNMPKNISNFLPCMKRLNVPVNEIENLTLLEGYENIQVLKLDRNSIKEILPYTFKDLPNLKELSLQANKIETLSEFSFYGLQNLQKLDLRENAIYSIHERAFYHLLNLEELLLDTNKLVNIPNNLFLKNKKLRRLYLSKNKIKTIGEEAFFNLTVDVINLRSNEIEVLPAKSLTTVRINHKVYLNNNHYRCNCELLLRLQTSMKELYDNDKLSLGNCYTSTSIQEEISTLQMENFNCSICDIKPCEKDFLCSVTNKTTYTHTCRKPKDNTRGPVLISKPMRVLDLNQSDHRLILWVGVSVCVGVLAIISALIIWVYYQRKRRRKFEIRNNRITYTEVTTPTKKAKKRSSIYLTMVTPTTTQDTHVLLYSP